MRQTFFTVAPCRFCNTSFYEKKRRIKTFISFFPTLFPVLRPESRTALINLNSVNQAQISRQKPKKQTTKSETLIYNRRNLNFRNSTNHRYIFLTKSRAYCIIYAQIKFHGVMAQLVARLNGIQKVRGSNPLSSTSPNLKRTPFERTVLGFFFFSFFCCRPTLIRYFSATILALFKEKPTIYKYRQKTIML